jgi:hypothetical protein
MIHGHARVLTDAQDLAKDLGSSQDAMIAEKLSLQMAEN